MNNKSQKMVHKDKKILMFIIIPHYFINFARILLTKN